MWQQEDTATQQMRQCPPLSKPELARNGGGDRHHRGDTAGIQITRCILKS